MITKTKVLYPLATGLWLYRNTKLSNDQICRFCSITEAQLIDLDYRNSVEPQDPFEIGQLTQEDIKKAEKKPDTVLVSRIKVDTKFKKNLSTEQKKYVPNAISWMVQQNISVSNHALSKFFSITAKKVQEIKDNIAQYSPRNPIMLGLCSRDDLNALIK